VIDAEVAIAAADAGAAVVRARFGTPLERFEKAPMDFATDADLAAGCVITGLRGQPLHTGAGGLVAAADSKTHAALIEIIGHQLAERGCGPGRE
jgi:hypothetical protein